MQVCKERFFRGKDLLTKRNNDDDDVYFENSDFPARISRQEEAGP